MRQNPEAQGPWIPLQGDVKLYCHDCFINANTKSKVTWILSSKMLNQRFLSSNSAERGSFMN